MAKKQITDKKISGKDSAVTRESVLEAFRKTMRPLNMDALLRVLGVPRRSKKALEGILADLMASGELIRLRGGSYGLMKHLKLVTGRLRVQRSGSGFVEPEYGGQALYIPISGMGDAWHGDVVAVARVPGARGGQGLSPEGRIARVVRRGMPEMALTALRFAGELLMAAPVDERIKAHFMVEGVNTEKVSRGDLLLAAPGEKIDDGLWSARLVKVLGDETSVEAQERIVKVSHGVPMEFPQAVRDEAAALPKAPLDREIREPERRDLRAVPFVTIDGADARDFDDAVHVERVESGWLLRVAIADVAHYVRPGTALDREARERGNSWYFPRSVEPMLPEALSNGLCSLKPDEPRLAMAAEIRFNQDGGRANARFFSACIQSVGRLVYDDVSGLFSEDPEARRQAREKLAPHAAMLETAAELAGVLKKRRAERGSLDFNVPEAQAIFDDDGVIAGIVAREMGVSNNMIEEFMLAANEAVARFLHDAGLPVLYRVHPEPEPEKLEGLFETLAATGLAEPVKRPSPAALRKVLRAGQDDARGPIIRRLALRTMMQARYSPALERHFGLAADCYCHFTSPIRRYADLIVHRALRRALSLPTYGDLPGEGALERIALGLNTRERSATEAEREIMRRLAVLFLSDKIGEEYHGVITGLIDFGFFVECQEVMAEGMVRLSSLSGDYFRFDPARQELLGERTGRAFRLGQAVRVLVQDVSMGRLEINFTLSGEKAGGLGKRVASGRARSPGAGKNAKEKSAARRKPAPPRKKPSSRKGATR